MEDAAVYAVAALAMPLTAWSVVEALRARAWGWLVSMVLLWPVGVIAWFVAGSRYYGDDAPTGPPPPPPTPDPRTRASA
jgi:hypothetical protein